MPHSLAETLRILNEHEPELRRRGVAHAAMFGSVARGEAAERSDVDILIDLDPERRIGLFDHAAIKLYIAELFGIDSLDGPIDVVNRHSLKPPFDATSGEMRSTPSKDSLTTTPAHRRQYRFIGGMDFEVCAADQKTFHAVTRALEIVSEASRRLPEDVNAHSQINWKAVAAAGNMYRHEYELVDPAVVWHTATVDLPRLEATVGQELARIDSPPTRPGST